MADMRTAFEHWFSDGGEWPAATARDKNGNYRLMQAHSSWMAWQAAWEAASPAVAQACERVGGFRFQDYGGWQQVAAEYENDADVTILHRERVAASPATTYAQQLAEDSCAANALQASEPAWQSMETAPRDGTRFRAKR